MKLELKHIAPYLPYGLKVKCDYYCTFGTHVLEITELSIKYYGQIMRGNTKPILRPWSDLTKEIEVNGKKFVPMTELHSMSDYSEYLSQIEEDVYEMNTPFRWPHEIFQKLIEWHFNVYNLPEHLFIDINTL